MKAVKASFPAKEAPNALTSSRCPCIGPMGNEHLETVVALGRACFGTSWRHDSVREEMHRSWAHLLVARPAPAQPVVAFLCYWLVVDEMHILHLATHRAYRRQGYARQLLERAFSDCSGVARLATLEVRPSNRAARALYESLGLQPVALRPRYYADTGESAVVMQGSVT